ncbi:homing endonuclease associated repeat-containing protein [Loigolactobacillus jiayinensis]|uniref:Homing endonuclease associated repeat-containing protein n=1 Tax=Loigolactobacillus jiayinensis TaxID=2486016 RepID=A0ABW1RJC7_9LACO|nr:hypothetical protein [Loigolactobacillus jiayinensis]
MTECIINITRITQLLFDESIQLQAISSLAGVRAGTVASYQRKAKPMSEMPLGLAQALSKVAESASTLAYARQLSTLTPKKIDAEVQRKRLANELQQQIKQQKRVPKSTEFRNYHLVVVHFGSWHNFLISQGIEDSLVKKPRQSTTTKEKMIAAYIEQASDLGHLPKSYEFRHYASAKRLFGSWAAFMAAIKIQ